MSVGSAFENSTNWGLKIFGKNMLNRSGESGHPCFFPEFKQEGFQLFTVEYYVSCGLS